MKPKTDIETLSNSIMQRISTAINLTDGDPLRVSGHQWRVDVEVIRNKYTKLRELYDDLANEELTINRIETKAG